MLKQIIRIYQNRSLREKFLLQGFIVIIFLIWTQLFIKKSSEWNNARNSASIELQTQQRWLDRENQYAEALLSALEKVEPSKTFSAAQLSGKIDAIIRSIKLDEKTDIDPVQTRIGEIFNDHTMRLRLNSVTVSELIKLNENLKTLSPYIAPKSIRINKNQRKPESMNVRFEINSFDLEEKNI